MPVHVPEICIIQRFVNYNFGWSGSRTLSANRQPASCDRLSLAWMKQNRYNCSLLRPNIQMAPCCACMCARSPNSPIAYLSLASHRYFNAYAESINRGKRINYEFFNISMRSSQWLFDYGASLTGSNRCDKPEMPRVDARITMDACMVAASDGRVMELSSDRLKPFAIRPSSAAPNAAANVII